MTRTKNILLYPFSLLYGALTWVRNLLYDTGILSSVEFHFPVICVGNITVGGTGKTPHTEYLTRLLMNEFRVATLSRGYKRKSKGFMVATPESGVADIGDEPMQMYRNFPDVLVTVDRNRVNGVRQILEDSPEIEVIILDDGFQHRRITPGFSILLSDFDRLFIRDHMLPYGNLREDKGNMRRADIILITKSPLNISALERRLTVKEINKSPYQNLYFTTFVYKDPVPVFDNVSGRYTESASDDTGIVLVTGIANPSQLKDHLKKSYKEITHLSYPDHHFFNEKDIQDISAAYNSLKSAKGYIFTTEKDAVRLREFTNIAEPMRSAFYYIPVGIHFLNDDKDEFDNLIIEYVRKNHRNN